jgi:hypothetical protein
MEPGLKESFIGVNVADSRDHSLIEQNRLQRSSGAGELAVPVSCVHFERFRTQTSFVKESPQGPRLDHRGLAKTAHIPKTELVKALIEIEDQMSVPRNRLRGGENPQLPRHTEMHEKTDRRVQGDNDPLSSPFNRLNTGALQMPAP